VRVDANGRFGLCRSVGALGPVLAGVLPASVSAAGVPSRASDSSGIFDSPTLATCGVDATAEVAASCSAIYHVSNTRVMQASASLPIPWPTLSFTALPSTSAMFSKSRSFAARFSCKAIMRRSGSTMLLTSDDCTSASGRASVHMAFAMRMRHLGVAPPSNTANTAHISEMENLLWQGDTSGVQETTRGYVPCCNVLSVLDSSSP
jgi:hypothetical protein